MRVSAGCAADCVGPPGVTTFTPGGGPAGPGAGSSVAPGGGDWAAVVSCCVDAGCRLGGCRLHDASSDAGSAMAQAKRMWVGVVEGTGSRRAAIVALIQGIGCAGRGVARAALPA